MAPHVRLAFFEKSRMASLLSESLGALTFSPVILYDERLQQKQLTGMVSRIFNPQDCFLQSTGGGLGRRG